MPRPVSTDRWTTLRSAVAPAWFWRRNRCFASSSTWLPLPGACLGRSSCSRLRGAGSTSGWPRNTPLHPASPSCAVATKGSTSGWPTIWSTGSCPWATLCWPEASWPRSWSSRQLPDCCRGARERHVDRGGELRVRPARIPAVHGPAQFREWAVPDVLLSGDHELIRRWRRAQALSRTLGRRPDLIDARGGLTGRGGPARRSRRPGPGGGGL